MFKAVMKGVEFLNLEAYTYLMEKDPKTWLRYYFQIRRCCGVVENEVL